MHTAKHVSCGFLCRLALYTDGVLQAHTVSEHVCCVCTCVCMWWRWWWGLLRLWMANTRPPPPHPHPYLPLGANLGSHTCHCTLCHAPTLALTLRATMSHRRFSRDDAAVIIKTMAKNKEFFIDHMMVQELGMMVPGDDEPTPLKQGLVMFCAFMVFGFVPLLAYCKPHTVASLPLFKMVQTGATRS